MQPTICDLDQLAAEIRNRLPIRGGIIAIDGPGASGKSTLATLLAHRLGNTSIVEGDDFYRPSHDQPTSGAPIGGQFDLDRLLSEVVAPGASGASISYQRYNWDADKLDQWVSIPVGALVIVEGIYSTERRLRAYYDYRIFCTAPNDLRLRRGIARDGESARTQWVDEWMPAEQAYIEAQRPDLDADIALEGRGDDTDEPAFFVLNRPTGPADTAWST